MKRTLDEWKVVHSPPLNHDFAFELLAKSELSATTQYSIAAKCVTVNDDQDTMFFVVTFRDERPSLREAQNLALRVYYHGAKRTPRALIFARRLVLEEETHFQMISLRPEEGLVYQCYETHQLRLDDGNRISAVYLTIDDVLSDTSAAFDVSFEPRVDTKMMMLQSEQTTFLKWFPPDLDPSLYGLTIDGRAIPQRTPLWFKIRGEMSGTQAVRLLGFFFGRDNGNKSLVARNAMRLGSQSEDVVMLCNLWNRPHRHFSEVGWCRAPGRYPMGWGASPDGLLTDLSVSWDDAPPATRAAWPDADISKGACEFKTSRTKIALEDYHIPQVYMEMIALGVVWCDLTRYRPGDQAAIYRIWRDPQLEERFLQLWKRALNNSHVLGKTIAEPEYVAMRRELGEMAAQNKAYRIVEMSEIQSLVDQYQQKQTALQMPDPELVAIPRAPRLTLRDLAERMKRQALALSDTATQLSAIL